ncbi:MAG: transporter substrate-binding domain-containing protein, partial [Candidatus Kariarchaeaceae archaeon]
MKIKLGFCIALLIIITTSGYNVPNSITTSEYGNDEFLDSLDAALYNIITSGVMETIYSKWFSGTMVLGDDSNSNTSSTFPTFVTSDGILDKIVQSGKIVFGADTTYPPFEFINGSGQIDGFDVDLANAIAMEFTNYFGTTIVAEMMTTDW